MFCHLSGLKPQNYETKVGPLNQSLQGPVYENTS